MPILYFDALKVAISGLELLMVKLHTTTENLGPVAKSAQKMGNFSGESVISFDPDRDSQRIFFCVN